MASKAQSTQQNTSDNIMIGNLPITPSMFVPVTSSSIQMAHNLIKGLAAGQGLADFDVRDTLLKVFANTPEDTINRALAAVDKVSAKALADARVAKVTDLVTQYNTDHAEDIDARVNAVSMSKAALVKAQSALDALRNDLAKSFDGIGILTVYVAGTGAEDDPYRFGVDSETKKGASKAKDPNAPKATRQGTDWTSGPWSKTFETYKKVSGPVTGTITVTGHDDDGYPNEFECKLSQGGMEFVARAKKANGASDRATRAFCEHYGSDAKVNLNVPSTYGIPRV